MTSTPTSILETLRRLVAEAKPKGHASMILSVSRPIGRRRRRAPRERVQIARGLTGRWVGDLQNGREGHILDVSVADAVAWLEKHGLDVDQTAAMGGEEARG